MESIGSFLYKKVDGPPKEEKASARSFRESLVNEFIENILIGNKGTKWEPKTDYDLKKFKRSIAIKINTNPFLRESWQLEGFLKACKAAKSFGACFYGSLSTKKKNSASIQS